MSRLSVTTCSFSLGRCCPLAAAATARPTFEADPRRPLAAFMVRDFCSRPATELGAPLERWCPVELLPVLLVRRTRNLAMMSHVTERPLQRIGVRPSWLGPALSAGASLQLVVLLPTRRQPPSRRRDCLLLVDHLGPGSERLLACELTRWLWQSATDFVIVN